MSSFTVLDLAIEGRIATLTLDRPKLRNALDRALRLALKAALDQVTADESVRVVVLTGAGVDFCAGADLTERLPEAGEPDFVRKILATEYDPVILGIRSMPKPVIAAINGTAAGIGASLALACDLVVMAEDAGLYSAFAKIGLVPDGGAHAMLLERLGARRAFEMVALSQRLDAARCAELGLANRVVPAGELLAQAHALAGKVAAAAPLTLAHSKRLLQEAVATDFATLLQREAAAQQLLFESRDFREGAQAFLEKRPPEFEGR